jgi:branched-chain amino acid transport system ATP-binding protein
VTILLVRDLAKSFGGVTAVDGVDFDLAAGEVLALIGPNGAGKTTCFNMLNGQLRPDRGRVELLGESILGLRPRQVWRRGVGRTFQITQTFGSLSVLANIQMALISHHRRVYDLWRRAESLHVADGMALLDRVGMADQADIACGVLSYGDLKRVELAVALANAPRLLLMDEPTAGMAPKERVALMELAKSLAIADGVSILFTEHDMDVVFAHADRIIVLNRGRLIAAGTPQTVRDDPEVRAVYLGSASFGGH